MNIDAKREGKRLTQYGDTVLLAGKDRKQYMRTLTPGANFSTKMGTLQHDDLVGKAYGSGVRTHLDHTYYILIPQPADLIAHARHETAIVQPKDLGYIALKLGIRPGIQVIEAGTGSGALTLVLALLVGDSGHVTSYERREALLEVAKKNLNRAQVIDRVSFVIRDISEGFNPPAADALFLDVPNPWDYLAHARAALTGGGMLGAIVPTINQLIELVNALMAGPWFMVEVEELLLRTYKISEARIRPQDEMVGHTGYLVFARAIDRGE